MKSWARGILPTLLMWCAIENIGIDYTDARGCLFFVLCLAGGLPEFMRIQRQIDAIKRQTTVTQEWLKTDAESRKQKA